MRAVALSGLVACLLILDLLAGLAVGVVVVGLVWGWRKGAST